MAFPYQKGRDVDKPRADDSREVLVAEPTSSGKYLGCHGITGTEQDLVARVPGSASNGRWCVR
jgi:hypothetical protein